MSRTVAISRIGHGLARALLGRAQHRVAHLGGAVAVLERGAVRRDVAVVADRRQQVVQLVHERVLPADRVPLRPPVLPERVVGLGDQHRAEARRCRSECCSSLRRSRSNASEPFEPLISHWNAFLRPSRSAWPRSCRRRRPRTRTAASTASSTSRPGWNVASSAATVVDLADEVAREVDHVRAEVAERARAGERLVEAPDLGRRSCPTPAGSGRGSGGSRRARPPRSARARAARRARSGS